MAYFLASSVWFFFFGFSLICSSNSYIATYFVLYLLLHLSTEWISIFDIFMFQTLWLDCNIAYHDKSSEIQLWGGFSRCSWGTEFSISNTRPSVTMLIPRSDIWELAVEDVISCGRRVYHKLSPLADKNWRILEVPEAKNTGNPIPSPERDLSALFHRAFRMLSWNCSSILRLSKGKRKWIFGSFEIRTERDSSHVSKVAELD